MFFCFLIGSCIVFRRCSHRFAAPYAVLNPPAPFCEGGASAEAGLNSCIFLYSADYIFTRTAPFCRARRPRRAAFATRRGFAGLTFSGRLTLLPRGIVVERSLSGFAADCPFLLRLGLHPALSDMFFLPSPLLTFTLFFASLVKGRWQQLVCCRRAYVVALSALVPCKV